MTEEEKNRHESEFQELLALYIALLRNWNTDQREESLFALSELRAEYAINYALDGLDISMEEAMNLMKNSKDENITQHDKELRNIVYAAIANLIDFSVCEEYQLYDDVIESGAVEGEIDFNSDEYDELIALCRRYNDTYTTVEDSDIKYAGLMAAFWIGLSSNDWLVYWTQNDSKVRPWHMELQGYAAPKDDFPSWMIPPIEYNCRCFLERLDVPMGKGDFHKIKNSTKKHEKPKQLSDIYSESLAKGGMIFGPSHDYFKVKESDKAMLKGFVNRLRAKYNI